MLDLGCGEERDSVFFARLGAVVTGVDLSAEGLTKARRLARAHGVRGRWVHGSMTSAIPAGAFDLFHRLRTLTRPGGHQAHAVFTDRLIYREEGEAVDYFSAGEMHEAFLEWQILARGDRCDQRRAGRDDARPRRRGAGGGAAVGASALAVRVVMT